MKKSGVSTIVATVFVVLLAVLAVTILFTFVMPTVNDNLAEATQEKVELSIQTSGGYTIWDATNKLAKVQVKRGNDNNNLEGINFKFYKQDSSLEHTSTDIPTQGQVKTYSFILGDFGKPEGIKITANIRKANGDVVEEVIPTGQTEAGEYFSSSGDSIDNGNAGDGDSCSAEVPSGVNYYLACNGVTIKCPGLSAGETFNLSGVTYTVVDNAALTAMNVSEDNYTVICTSAVTNLANRFQSQASFNQDLSGWDVSSVTSMRGLFDSATSFNQDISDWDTSKVTDMAAIFIATSFNQDISDWDTSKVNDMSYMFWNANSFNQSLNNWDTSSVRDMYSMFSGATSFNQDISDWDTSVVREMGYMFSGASSFDQNISSWNVTAVHARCDSFNASTSASWTADEKPALDPSCFA